MNVRPRAKVISNHVHFEFPSLSMVSPVRIIDLGETFREGRTVNFIHLKRIDFEMIGILQTHHAFSENRLQAFPTAGPQPRALEKERCTQLVSGAAAVPIPRHMASPGSDSARSAVPSKWPTLAGLLPRRSWVAMVWLSGSCRSQCSTGRWRAIGWATRATGMASSGEDWVLGVEDLCD